MITCLYIEVRNIREKKRLEDTLIKAAFPYYDASEMEPALKDCRTLEEVEILYEGK